MPSLNLSYTFIKLQDFRMHSTNLRKVGGSIMLAVPPALLNALDLHVGSKVGIGIEDGRIVVHKNLRPKYTLDELLEQSDEDLPIDAEDHLWLDGDPVGKELI